MNLFKKTLTVVTLGLVLGGSRMVPAALSVSPFATTDGITYQATGSGSQVIPDYPGAGVGYSISFGDTGVSINNLSVTLNISGGYNGDIYAYLSHGSQFAVLVNQISGTAGSGSGFNNVELVEGTGSTIQSASGSAGLSFTGTFTADNDLSVFNNTDPNGNWTLFFADMAPGDQSTLTGFSLDVMAVPEPITVALVIFAALVILKWWIGKYRTAKAAGQ